MTRRAECLANLPYFISWGGEGALVLGRRIFEEVLPQDLSGMKILEIGAGGGKMSSLFALLGADVVGIDFAPDYPAKALAEAEKWGVVGHMDFRRGAEALADLPDGTFDLAFTKSVLLCIEDLEGYMRALAPKLKPGGRVCFLENVSRNFLDRLLRNLIHLVKGKRNYSYMTPKRIAAIGRVFQLESEIPLVLNRIPHARTPGWYLISGYRRPSAPVGAAVQEAEELALVP